MYKGIGESAYNDGLFSQAAPFQEYQASVSQFGDGALGAFSRLAPPGLVSTNVRRRASHRPGTLPPRGGHSLVGMGNAYHDGVLGHTFLPAFSPQEMRGLGYAYRDGVLGADPSATIQIGPPIQTAPSWKPDLASAGIGVMAGALLFYVLKL
jgi:hypothetical protein